MNTPGLDDTLEVEVDMLVALLSSLALGAEPCVPAVTQAVFRAADVVPMGAPPDPVVRRFVTGEGIDAIRRALSTVPGRGAYPIDAVHVDHIPGPRTLASVLEMGGATRGIDGAVRLRGGAPRVILDGVPLRSALE